MKKQDLEHLLKTLKYGLNDCNDINDNSETHFNSFANAINLVQGELNLLKTHIVSTRTFECEIYIDTENKMHPQQKLETKRAFFGACGQMLMMLRDDLPKLSDEDGYNKLDGMINQVGQFFINETHKQN